MPAPPPPPGFEPLEAVAPAPPPGFEPIRGTAPPPPPGFEPAGASPVDKGNALTNLPRSAADFAGGMAASVLNPMATVKNVANTIGGGVSKVARKGMEAVTGKPVTPDPAEATFDNVVANYSKRYGSPKQAWETFNQDPVGTIADASMVLGGTGAALKAGGLSKAANVARTASELSNPLVLPGRAVAAATKIPGVAPALKATANRLYQSALKPPPGTFTEAEQAAMLQEGLDRKIPVGLLSNAKAKTQGFIDDINRQVANRIQVGAAAGDTIDPFDVARRTQRSAKTFRNQVNPTADMQTVGNSTNEFLRANGGVSKKNPLGNPIPVDLAQDLKTGTYRQLRDKYGELSTAANETQKDLARGLKEEIYQKYPELEAQGRSEGNLINLEEANMRYDKRHGNRDVAGVGPMLKMIAGAKVGGIPGAVAGAAGAAAEMPAIKSRLGIKLNSMAKGELTPAARKQLLQLGIRVNDLDKPQPIE